MDIMLQSARLFVNPITVDSYGFCSQETYIPMWNSSGKKELFRASLYVLCLRY